MTMPSLANIYRRLGRYSAPGSAASAIELTCDELERCCGKNFVQWVDVCKGWQPEEA